MNYTLKMKDYLYNLAKTDIYAATIPLGFATGLPMVQILNQQLLLKIPFYQMEIAHTEHKSLIFPIRYCLTAHIPSGRIVGFEDLAFSPIHSKLPFDKPIGFTPLKKAEKGKKNPYKEKRDTLMALYDKMLAHIMGDGDFTHTDEVQFKELFNELLTPALVPQYLPLADKFCAKYIAHNDKSKIVNSRKGGTK